MLKHPLLEPVPRNGDDAFLRADTTTGHPPFARHLPLMGPYRMMPGTNPAFTAAPRQRSPTSASGGYTVPKVRDTDPDALNARIRELTEECRRLREELGRSTKDRIAHNAMANDIPMPPRRNRPRPKKQD